MWMVLAFSKRVLHVKNHNISISMRNIAYKFSRLGQYADTLKLQEECLEFNNILLLKDHLYIGTRTNKLAATYSDPGRYADVLKLNEETHAFLKRVLPVNRPDIGTNMRVRSMRRILSRFKRTYFCWIIWR